MNIIVKFLIRITFVLNILIAGITMASSISSNKVEDSVSTSKYYHDLISSDDIAELNIFLTDLPKGGDIHHHFSGAIYAEGYLDRIDDAGFCINKNSYQMQEIKTTENCLSVTELETNNALYTKILDLWSYNQQFTHHHNEEALNQFFNIFGYYALVEKLNIKNNLILLKERAKAENVQYIETILFIAPNSSNPGIDNINQLTSNTDDATIDRTLNQSFDFLNKDVNLQNEITKFIHEMNSNSRDIDDNNFSIRFQSYVVRTDKPSLVFSGLYSGFLIAQNNNKFVGVNIVGNEAAPSSLKDYKLHMKMVRFLKQKFPNVKVSLHAGELALGLVPQEELRSHIRPLA